MLKTKILAANLANLTDARYFAAWGVDYMAFDISADTDLTLVKEIIDWVEGPTMAVHYSGLESMDLINEQLLALEVDHIVTGPYAKSELLESDWQTIKTVLLDSLDDSLPSMGSYIVQSDQSFITLSKEQRESLKSFAASHDTYLDCGFNASSVDDILDLGISGLVLRGGEEEKVGVKRYDDLDEIIEQLEID